MKRLALMWFCLLMVLPGSALFAEETSPGTDGTTAPAPSGESEPDCK